MTKPPKRPRDPNETISEAAQRLSESARAELRKRGMTDSDRRRAGEAEA